MIKNSLLFRRAAWVAVLALMLQALMPLLHPAMAIPAAAASDSGIRRCSMRLTASNVTEKSDTGKTSPSKLPSCPICMTMHMLAGGYLPPTSIVFIAITRDTTIIALQPDSVVTPVRIVSSAQPRAPPFLA